MDDTASDAFFEDIPLEPLFDLPHIDEDYEISNGSHHTLFDITLLDENTTNMPSPPLLDNTVLDIYLVNENETNLPSPPLVSVSVPETQVSSIDTCVSTVSASLQPSETWSGEHEFKVVVQQQDKNMKSIHYAYSEIENRLYVKKDQPFPVDFFVNGVVCDDLTISTQVLFCNPEHMSDVVHRCSFHLQEDFQKDVFEWEHLVRCECATAIYKVNPETKCLSVIVPFENPPVGQCFSRYIYKMTCFTSCKGGPNGRPMMLLFSLKQRGLVIGRVKMNVRVCSVPGRDIRSSEAKFFDLQNKPSTSKKRKEPGTSLEILSFPDAMKKSKRSVPNEEECYIIKVRDAECAEFLKQMKRWFKAIKEHQSSPMNLIHAFFRSYGSGRDSDSSN